MKLTVTHDPDAGVVRFAFEVSDTAPPDRTADAAWTAVDHALTQLQQRQEVPR